MAIFYEAVIVVNAGLSNWAACTLAPRVVPSRSPLVEAPISLAIARQSRTAALTDYVKTELRDEGKCNRQPPTVRCPAQDEAHGDLAAPERRRVWILGAAVTRTAPPSC